MADPIPVRYPRKTKKMFLKKCGNKRLTPKEQRRWARISNGGRNLADYYPHKFVDRCLELAWAVGWWDYQLFD